MKVKNVQFIPEGLRVYAWSNVNEFLEYAHVSIAGTPLCHCCNTPLPRIVMEIKKPFLVALVEGDVIELSYWVYCTKCGSRHIYVYAQNLDAELMFVEYEV